MADHSSLALAAATSATSVRQSTAEHFILSFENYVLIKGIKEE
jgi:hypothetical protein